MRLSRTRPATADEPTIALDGLHRSGCDDPEHEQWWDELEVLRAECDQYKAALKAAGDEVATRTAERDAAQAQLARHLAEDTRLPSLGIDWDEPIPEGARGTGDWPDVAGDKGEDVPERIEVTE